MLTEIEKLGCTVEHLSGDSDKPLCVLGVLKTQAGIQIKQEMLSVLGKTYDIYTVEQEPPGNLFEYPAIKFAMDLSKETGCNCLYVHTKGAANQSAIQSRIRQLWYDEFIGRFDDYNKVLGTNKPTVACPYTGIGMHTWFNGFMFNKSVAENVTVKKSDDRYYYESLFSDYRGTVNVVGLLRNGITSKTTFLMFADMRDRYSLKTECLV